MKDDANAGFYDSDSTTYDSDRWVTNAGAYTFERQKRIVDELTAGWSNSEVLEVGPGTARFTIPIARKRNKITLVDISTGMLDVAQENIANAGLNDAISEAIEGSLYDLPFSDSKFDFAVSLNVLSHIEDSATAIGELARVVKPGGQVLLNYPNLESFYWPAARRINARSKAVGLEVFSIWERPGHILRRIHDAGLELVTRRGHAHVPRAVERFHLLPLIRALDAVSRRGPISRLAPVHFCLCQKIS